VRPQLWLLAGPNGSGKSTLARTGVFARLSGTPERPADLTHLDPDEAARRLRAERPGLSEAALALHAAQRSDEEVDRAIGAHRSLLVETVMSSDKFLARVDRARAEGYWIGLIFVLLRTPDLNVGRVAIRAAQGGHAVPEDRVRARWVRSLARLAEFAARADAFAVWDNSYWGGPPELLVEVVNGRGRVSDPCRRILDDPGAHPALVAALRSICARIAP
jgi:predicted ABC-type ATPase